MKTKITKTLLLVMASVSLVFISCNKDDDNNSSSTTSGNLIGKWYMYSEKTVTNGVAGNEQLWAHNCSSKLDYVEFKSNGSADWIQYAADCTVDAASSVSSAEWERSGNIINFEMNGEIFSEEITTLNSNTLIVKDVDEYNGTTYDYITTYHRAN
jgi:hypothetical protein